MSSGPLLQVEGLSRSFGGLAALRGLSLMCGPARSSA